MKPPVLPETVQNATTAAAAASISACIALAPWILTPSRPSSGPQHRALTQGGQAQTTPPRTVKSRISAARGSSGGTCVSVGPPFRTRSIAFETGNTLTCNPAFPAILRRQFQTPVPQGCPAAILDPARSRALLVLHDDALPASLAALPCRRDLGCSR